MWLDLKALQAESTARWAMCLSRLIYQPLLCITLPIREISENGGSLPSDFVPCFIALFTISVTGRARYHGLTAIMGSHGTPIQMPYHPGTTPAAARPAETKGFWAAAELSCLISASCLHDSRTFQWCGNISFHPSGSYPMAGAMAVFSGPPSSCAGYCQVHSTTMLHRARPRNRLNQYVHYPPISPVDNYQGIASSHPAPLAHHLLVLWLSRLAHNCQCLLPQS